MTTTVRGRRARTDGPNGTAPPGPARARPATLGLRARVPHVVVPLGLAVGSALVGVLWHLSTTERQAVLALAAPVERGQVIEADDLRVVYLSSDDAVAHLTRDQATAVVGRPARAAMAAGTVLTEAAVQDGPRLEAGEGVVGLSLEAGQVPLDDLVPGDVVDVVGAGEAGASGTDPTIATGATVYAVGEVGAQGRQVVSIKLGHSDATAVAAAAERGALRLVLVGRS